MTSQKRFLNCIGLAIKRFAARSKTRPLFDMLKRMLKNFNLDIFEKEIILSQNIFSQKIIFEAILNAQSRFCQF